MVSCIIRESHWKCLLLEKNIFTKGIWYFFFFMRVKIYFHITTSKCITLVWNIKRSQHLIWLHLGKSPCAFSFGPKVKGINYTKRINEHDMIMRWSSLADVIFWQLSKKLWKSAKYVYQKLTHLGIIGKFKAQTFQITCVRIAILLKTAAWCKISFKSQKCFLKECIKQMLCFCTFTTLISIVQHSGYIYCCDYVLLWTSTGCGK